ncbi:lysine--tRNA ligase [Fimbriimonas ginsengisoli]|uniref:Lysine--tRNA ligase n=1 Tax=Fimbriimonas ginsengisoli Gsoil 348 TaxID=661478 RepID=A0A068NW07_FIMGI|nr:lysine--tRNA ligase [Fimbriimonas ginsengisoli]AIE87611.1 Lysyl-tRNA synthetase (class II) [Fimbriimonas ginsengisoli Gsoil 348]
MNEELSLREVRLVKLQRMRELGHDPYRVEKWERTQSAHEMLETFEEQKPVSFAGRVVSYRLMGKAGFAHISDGDGRIQGYFRKDDLGEVGWELYNLLDVGDHIGVKGYLFTTKTGEKSIHVSELQPLSKALQNLPIGKEKDGHVFYGLTDVDQRYRHRHLDLLSNADARRTLIDRMRITRAVRHYFDSHGYLEVETPILQIEAGGATARPFHTHYNAYETDVKLRISLELYLKRLICGDLPRVYEIGRVFRNEGVSQRHNPEFTLLEFYEAYADMETMMQRVEECFRFVANEVYGSPLLVDASCDEEGVGGGEKRSLDFGKPWKRVNLLQEIEGHTGLTHDDLSSLEKAQKALGHREVVNPATGKRINADDENNLGGLIEKLLEVFVEPTLQEPTFVVGYPIETSPLAKKDPNNPRMTQRFEGYILGKEVCNAFSEINDPIDQRERFEQQLGERAKGDDEAHPMDEEFIYALECGMPPTGGCGIGIDRMAMMLTGSDHLREVLLFPFMRPTAE